jgi:hypothetical protein
MHREAVLGISNSSIGRVCAGERATAGGYQFRQIGGDN